MNLVAVDTSHARGTLVIEQFINKVRRPLASREWEKKAMHSDVATLELEAALQHAGLTLPDLTHLAVNLGPGSFTGLRVGINMVRTLAYTLGLPVACFNTLEILAWREAEYGQRILVANKAVQQFYYGAVFEKTKAELLVHVAPKSMTENDMRSLSALLGCTKTLTDGLVHASDMVTMLDQSAVQRHFFSWPEVKPLYVRGSEAEEKMKKGLLKSL